MSDIEMTEESDFETFEEEEEDQEFVFEPVVAERNQKKNYQVDFKPLNTTELQGIIAGEMAHVSNILGCPPETASTLLRYFKWNKEKLIESYMEDDEATTKAAGVLMFEDRPQLMAVPGFVCDICCNDEGDLKTLALLCQHRYCQDCYEHYLTMKITEEGESRHITCPGSGCKLIVDEKTVELVVKPDVFQKYQTLLLKTYVDDRANIKWCPHPNCENAVQCKITPAQLDEIVPSVECGSHHRFCFGCSLSDHQPATCSVAKRWLKKCQDDSETSNWLAANTKECPKCNSTIEKNGGCNHMTCKKCKHEFCWMCHGEWAQHGNSWYNCNRYEEKDAVDARDAQARSRAALERYLHSAKLDKELFEKTEKKMDQMQQSSEFSWIQVQFLKSAVEVLLRSRQTLMWTYALAYFLSRTSNATALFEDNQKDLEMAVEGLSQMLETEITAENAVDVRKKVLDKTEYVNRRSQVLLSDTASGHLEKRWQYSFEP
ncbi:hypothetical protein HDV03_002029 [Kappamyces sp. JEL0829]|nr:hypothetical protein HDV03_002029 [Kappamyces sp. JEL0829]